MYVSTLLADPRSLRLERIVSAPNQITLVVKSVLKQAACPSCAVASSHVHSRYIRHVADLPWHSIAVRLELHARRFFCRQDDCRRKVFCERLPSVVAPHAQRTLRLNDALSLIGFALGGEAGARAAVRLGMSTSPDTLLCRIRQAAFEQTETPRVVGIDDWAKRKGHSYGTIIVDLERRRPIDLLPGREAETLAAWLRAHPGIEVISRDRAGAYAEAARTGAPDAVQVADRWHILKNMTEAVERFIARQRQCVRQAAERVTEKQAASASTNTGRTVSLSSHQPQESHHNIPRRARYTEVIELHGRGISARHISRLLGLHRNTVRRFITAAEYPQRAAHRLQPSKLDPFTDYLERRWREGCHNVQQLWREIVQRGYQGRVGMVRRYVQHLRAPSPTPAATTAQATQHEIKVQKPVRVPSTRSAAWWLQRRAEQLTDEQKLFIEQFCAICPEAGAVQQLAHDFQRMLRERKVEELDGWLAVVARSHVKELKNFAQGLKQDRAAVTAALQYEWSQGQTEGQVNRLKLLKRQSYGRAKFDLLRARVLHAA